MRFACLFVVACLLGCSDYGSARSALQSMGFTDIVLDSPKVMFSGCGKDDFVNHPFRAKNTAGRDVSGTVCCGGPLSFKGCTVRF